MAGTSPMKKSRMLEISSPVQINLAMKDRNRYWIPAAIRGAARDCQK
jgi:hypothetical protein